MNCRARFTLSGKVRVGRPTAAAEMLRGDAPPRRKCCAEVRTEVLRGGDFLGGQGPLGYSQPGSGPRRPPPLRCQRSLRSAQCRYRRRPCNAWRRRREPRRSSPCPGRTNRGCRPSRCRCRIWQRMVEVGLPAPRRSYAGPSPGPRPWRAGHRGGAGAYLT